MNNKLNSLQIIRAYAACLVGMCHIWNDGILPETVNELGGFGVALFFVLSGFIMCLTVKIDPQNKIENAKLFLRKRVVRIFPIYLICAIPLILFVSVAEGTKSLFFYIGNILLLPSFFNDPAYRLALPPGWSLVYEMFFYYIFTLLLLFFTSKRKLLYSLIAFFVILISVVHLLNIHGPQLAWVNFSYLIGDTLMLNFAFGIIAYFIYSTFKDRISFTTFQTMVLLLILTLVALILIYYKAPRIVSMGIPSFIIILIFLFAKQNNSPGRLMKTCVFIGDASYSIYLTHFYFAFFKLKVIAIVGQIIENRDLLINGVDITLLVMSILCGCAFYSLVERPIINHFSTKQKR